VLHGRRSSHWQVDSVRCRRHVGVGVMVGCGWRRCDGWRISRCWGDGRVTDGVALWSAFQSVVGVTVEVSRCRGDGRRIGRCWRDCGVSVAVGVLVGVLVPVGVGVGFPHTLSLPASHVVPSSASTSCPAQSAQAFSRWEPAAESNQRSPCLSRHARLSKRLLVRRSDAARSIYSPTKKSLLTSTSPTFVPRHRRLPGSWPQPATAQLNATDNQVRARVLGRRGGSGCW